MAESKWTRHEVQFRGVPNALRPRHDVNLLRGGGGAEWCSVCVASLTGY